MTFDIDKYHNNFCIKCVHLDRKNIAYCLYYESMWYSAITECVNNNIFVMEHNHE